MAGERRNASAISDRSGVRFRMREMVKEPGTGYLVHRTESDGKWNIVDIPFNNPHKYVRYGDPFPVRNARPERKFEPAPFLTDENGDILLMDNNIGVGL